MKKIIIAGIVTTVIAAMLFHDKEAAASQRDLHPPRPKAGTQNHPGKPKPHRDGECRNNETSPPSPQPPQTSQPSQPNNDTDASSTGVTELDGYTVTISGGFDTDPQDHGRPDVLIAAALGVPTEVFREAFSGVTPAGLDRGPTSEEAQRNKAALLKVLAPYGITNDRLDEVSDYYRYNGKKEGRWETTLATATPVITNGELTGVTVTNPGSGYSSTPTVTIEGPDGIVTAKANITFTTDFDTNGSISSITLE